MSILSLPARVATLPGGLQIPYVEQGDPDGVPVVFLHGLTDSHRSYEPVLAELPDSIHAYAVTARGHGDADKPDGGYDAAQMAEDVIAFMDAVGIEQAVVAGHSMGSWHARRAAEMHPERFIGVVLAGCFATFDKPDIRDLLASFSGLGDPIESSYAQAWQESTLAFPVPEAFMEMVVEETCKPPAHVWSAALAGLLADRDASPGAIRVPVLLAWGENDAMVPRSDQDALLAAIPHARFVVYQGGGHALHWERPERYARDVMAFIAEL
jgi:non-heme chloroperoxidase